MASRLSILAVTTALTLSLAMPAFAQTSEDEVVVTATKRNETIFDVPLAVTAVTGETLEQAQIRLGMAQRRGRVEDCLTLKTSRLQ